MLEIKVTVIIPGLMELANALMGSKQPAAQQPTVQPQMPSAPVSQMPASQPVPQAPVQTSMPQMPAPQPPVNQYFGQPMSAPQPVTAPQPPVNQYFGQQPAPQPVPTQSAPQQMPPAPVPTANVAQQYTQDQIAVAMTELMDAGKAQVVSGIMDRFGVKTLMALPKDRYPEVVILLREAGARI